jgi:autotransporter-associated beta strand protein
LIQFNPGKWATIDLHGALPTVSALDFTIATGYDLSTTEGGRVRMLGAGAAAATISANAATIGASTGSNRISVPLTLAGALTVTTGPDAALALAGEVDGPGILTKEGSGRLELSGTNHYGGTVVNAGELLAATAGALPTGESLSIAGGGTVVLAVDLCGPAGKAAAVAAVPEPGTVGLLLAGALMGLAMGLARRRA